MRISTITACGNFGEVSEHATMHDAETYQHEWLAACSDDYCYCDIVTNDDEEVASILGE